MKSFNILAKIMIALIAILPFFPEAVAYQSSDNSLIVERGGARGGQFNRQHQNYNRSGYRSGAHRAVSPNQVRDATGARDLRGVPPAYNPYNQGNNPVIVVPQGNQPAPINPAPYPQ